MAISTSVQNRVFSILLGREAGMGVGVGELSGGCDQIDTTRRCAL